jgi:hypothetical protein
MRQTPAIWGDITGNASKRASDADLLQAAHHLVEVYLVYLRQHETVNNIFDTRELPAAKDALINAFRVVIATENRPNVRALLVKAGMTLAHFQDNIGEPLPVRPIPGPAKLQAARGRIDIARIRKIDRAILRLWEERTYLETIFQKASKLAEGKPFYHA